MYIYMYVCIHTQLLNYINVNLNTEKDTLIIFFKFGKIEK